ncbi:hypothetical protein GCM10010392_28780 [Streptomyces clavifer]|nr:hypothetical protein GCM10010392_28780 [Streptomyces clavifer]
MTTVTLCAVFAMMLALGQAVAARHRAGGAADLASLAAADRAPRGEAEACGAAREVAGAQGAELIRCVVQGEIADVTARVRFGPYAPEVRSRAGPPAAEEFGTPETAPTRDGAPVPTRDGAPVPTWDGAPVAPGAAAATPGAQIRAALKRRIGIVGWCTGAPGPTVAASTPCRGGRGTRVLTLTTDRAAEAGDASTARGGVPVREPQTAPTCRPPGLPDRSRPADRRPAEGS